MKKIDLQATGVVDDSNPKYFLTMLGIVLDQVCYTLQLTNILLNNYIKSHLSNVVCSKIHTIKLPKY